MSYEKALMLAGAEIIAFQQFGSYQGEWWCLCKYNNEIGWANGSYGSCSGCDAFESEFGWQDEEAIDYLDRMKEFGKRYLVDSLLNQEDALKSASEMSWDDESKNMIEFIQNEWSKLKNEVMECLSQ